MGRTVRMSGDFHYVIVSEVGEENLLAEIYAPDGVVCWVVPDLKANKLCVRWPTDRAVSVSKFCELDGFMSTMSKARARLAEMYPEMERSFRS
jgi:hypothetical protein